ncbi:hypothetical protein C8Q72DRAFT_65492 [Fomitopsis betulina]|nr:hypothetical protein C8Q72DRAFT_65492 [Fomitopsis betulina]
MRFSTLIPLAFASLATFAAASPRHQRRDDGFDLYARGDDYDLYARNDDVVTLLAREVLYARMDAPKREHYSSTESYEAAYRPWNRHHGQHMRDTQNAMAKHSQAGDPMPSGQKDFASWNRDNRKVDHMRQKSFHRENHGHAKDVNKIGKKECKKGSGSKCDVM